MLLTEKQVPANGNGRTPSRLKMVQQKVNQHWFKGIYVLLFGRARCENALSSYSLGMWRQRKKEMQHPLHIALLTKFYSENIYKIRHIFYNLRKWKKSYPIEHALLPRSWLMVSVWHWALSTDQESRVDCNAASCFHTQGTLAHLPEHSVVHHSFLKMRGWWRGK